LIANQPYDTGVVINGARLDASKALTLKRLRDTLKDEMEPDSNYREIAAPIMALDLGRKRVGVAVSDELRISVRRLNPLKRSNWKRLLGDVTTLTRRFDAQTLVIGLPLSLDGTTREAALEIKQTAMNFARSLSIPVFLQDERLTSVAAEENLRSEGLSSKEIMDLVDSESAAIILRDFISGGQDRLPVSPIQSGG
jgi:putative Holliday junction resolvase